MKKVQITLAAICLSAALNASASFYNINFTGGTATASGQIDVVGGVAISGWLDVTTGPNTGNNFILATPFYSNVNGDNLGNDNLVDPTTAPYINGNGLGFGNANQGFAIWYDGGVNYKFWGYDYPSPPGGGWGSPYENGSFTISLAPSAPVPEPSTIVAGAAMLLPFGFTFVRMFRNRRMA